MRLHVAAAVTLLAVLPLAAKAQSIELTEGSWHVFSVNASDAHGRLSAAVSPLSGNPDLFVRRGSAPTLTEFDASSTETSGNDSVTLTALSSPSIDTGTYYVGVYARTATTFTVNGNAEHVPSPRAGMGAVPFNGGTTFRVWAPFADSVAAAGTFNSWSSTAAPMQSEGNGHWSIDVRNALPGHEYKFVIQNGASTLWKIDPRARQVTSSVGNGVIFDDEFEWSPAAYATPNWNEMVIYQMHIGTFNDSPGGAPGTFQSAVNRLDYLKGLGINTIQLLPVQEFAGDFSWGYNPAHPFSVETAYGGPLALKQFVDEAHKRGIAVLLDMVHNHYGPSDLDMWRFDGWYQGSWGGIYFYQDDRAVTPWGDTRPDFGRGEVRQYIRDNMMLWAQQYRVDGFRWDSTLNIRRHNNGDNGDGWSLMQWLNNELDGSQPWKINIAEDLQNDSWITRSTADGGAGFDSQWAANFVHPVRAAIETDDDNNRDMFSVRDAVSWIDHGNAFSRVIYTESHDEVANGRQRVPSSIDSGNSASYWAKKRSTLGAALTFTSPGIPMMFQGQEILEDGWFADTDPVDWSKLTTHAGINQLYKDLISLRTNARGHSRGLTGQNHSFYHINNTDKVVAYHRWLNGGEGDDVVVVANFSYRNFTNYRVGLPRGGNWTVAVNSDWTRYSSDFGTASSGPVFADINGQHGLAHSGEVSLAPYSFVVLTYVPQLSFTFPTVGSPGGKKVTATLNISSAAPIDRIVNLSSSSSLISVPGAVTIPANASSVNFSMQTQTTPTDETVTLTASANGMLEGSGTHLVRYPRVSGVSFDTYSLVSGQSTMGTLNLGSPAPAGGWVVTLTNSNPSALNVPSTVTIPAGQARVRYTVTAKTVPSATTAKVEGTPSFNEKSSTISISPAGAFLTSVTAPDMVVGDSTRGVVNLGAPAPAGGVTVNLSINTSRIAIPATVTVPEGSTVGEFSISALQPISNATITATNAGTTVTDQVSSVAVALMSMSVSPNTVTVGNSTTLTATLNVPAPRAIVINVTMQRAGRVTVDSLVVPAGSTTGTAQVWGVAPGSTWIYGRIGTQGTRGAFVTVN